MSQLKVLLINPWNAECFPPPSIGYLQAVAKQHANVVAMDYDEAMQQPDNFDIVGVSFHSFSVKFAKAIREKFSCWLVCGGHHPSALPEQMLSIGYNQVVIGQGEAALIEIIKGNIEPILRVKAKDINDLPFPDYSGLKFDISIGMPVISSRGCPFDCSFCASADFWNRKWYMRAAENVVSEIKHFGYNEFMFDDDNFTLNKKRLIEICNALGDGYYWQCTSRVETLIDDEICEALKKGGCHNVWVGVESLSQPSLDRCGKGTTVERIIKGIQNAERHGLTTTNMFIVGLPDDTEADIEETCNQIKINGIKNKSFQILWIVPGTEAYRRAKKQGFDDNIFLESGAPFYTYEQSIETLNNWYNKLMQA